MQNWFAAIYYLVNLKDAYVSHWRMFCLEVQIFFYNAFGGKDTQK